MPRGLAGRALLRFDDQKRMTILVLVIQVSSTTARALLPANLGAGDNNRAKLRTSRLSVMHRDNQ